jgi:hypothetical protein
MKKIGLCAFLALILSFATGCVPKDETPEAPLPTSDQVVPPPPGCEKLRETGGTC